MCTSMAWCPLTTAGEAEPGPFWEIKVSGAGRCGLPGPLCGFLTAGLHPIVTMAADPAGRALTVTIFVALMLPPGGLGGIPIHCLLPIS